MLPQRAVPSASPADLSKKSPAAAFPVSSQKAKAPSPGPSPSKSLNIINAGPVPSIFDVNKPSGLIFPRSTDSSAARSRSTPSRPIAASAGQWPSKAGEAVGRPIAMPPPPLRRSYSAGPEFPSPSASGDDSKGKKSTTSAAGSATPKVFIGPNLADPKPSKEPLHVVAKKMKNLLDTKWQDMFADAEYIPMKFDWTPEELSELEMLTESLCAGCIKLLRQEEYPLLHITSPLFVLGDIHGRFDDLAFLLSQFYIDGKGSLPHSRARSTSVKGVRIANNVLIVGDDGEVEIDAMADVPSLLSDSCDDLNKLSRRDSSFCGGKEALQTNRLLFLGDFVDRGFASLEVVLYVLALKAIDPANIFLLRGNHELQIINQNYGFLDQCQQMYGERQGHEIWSTINRVFDFMPLAAVLDENIFCAHGGIPRAGLNGWEDRMSILQRKAWWQDIRDSNEQWDKLQEDKFARFKEVFDDLLWADPAPDTVELDENGFGPSVRGISVSYSTRAVDAFLQATSFSLILRAHEVQAKGFNVCKGGRVITIFTSSYYDDNSNMAGAAFIANGTIRAVTRRQA